MVAVTALGLAAAFLFALSAFLQQRAARLLGRLARSRLWLTGWLTDLCGVGTQAAALKVGSVAAVQPLMAAQLLFVLALASGERRRWPSARDWLSALTVCAASLIVMLRQVSRHTIGWLASLLVGVTAGLCHALNAVYLKLTVEDLFHGGVLATLYDWPVYALAVTALSGMLLVQIAFAIGPLPPAVAAMSVTNPVASFILGILAFSAPAPRDPVVLAAIAAAGVLITAGIIGLAKAIDPPRSESRYGSSRCPATAVSGPPGGSDGSTPARTDASRLSASE